MARPMNLSLAGTSAAEYLHGTPKQSKSGLQLGFSDFGFLVFVGFLVLVGSSVLTSGLMQSYCVLHHGHVMGSQTGLEE